MTQGRRDVGRPSGQPLRRRVQGVLTAPANAYPAKPYQKKALGLEASSLNGRSAPREVSADDVFRRQYRPKSGAEAFLVLERDVDGRISRRFPEHEGPNRARRNERPNVGAYTLPRGSKAPSSRVQATSPDEGSRLLIDLHRSVPEKTRDIINKEPMRTFEDAFAGPCEDTPRARVTMGENCILTRSIRSKKIRRISKALPALPRESRDRSTGVLKSDLPYDLPANGATAPQGRGLSTLRSAPQLSSTSKHYNTSASSTSTYDSAEKTWNMIEDMMHAVGEDEVRRARTGLPRYGLNDNLKSDGSVSFPRTGSSGNSDVDTFSVSGLERGRRNGFHAAVRGQPPRLDRSGSDTSAFSIVIQPSDPMNGSGSRERDAFSHVAEEDLPVRIKRLLRKARCWDTMCSTPTAYQSSLHDDLSTTLEALREVDRYELEDIKFDKDGA